MSHRQCNFRTREHDPTSLRPIFAIINLTIRINEQRIHTRSHPIPAMPNKNDSTVLSLSGDHQALRQREAALRAAEFDVISVDNSVAARFEIEMGRCGIFLTCDKFSPISNRELTTLFRYNCPTGWIVFVTSNAAVDGKAPDFDVCVPESDDPQGIVKALQLRTLKQMESPSQLQ